MYGHTILAIKYSGVAAHPAMPQELINLLIPDFGLRPRYGMDANSPLPLKNQAGIDCPYGSAAYHKIQIEREVPNFGLPEQEKNEIKKLGFLMGVIPEAKTTIFFTMVSNNKIGIYFVSTTFGYIKEAAVYLTKYFIRQQKILKSKANNNNFTIEFALLSDRERESFIIVDEISSETIYKGYMKFRILKAIYKNQQDIFLSIAVLILGVLFWRLYPNDQNAVGWSINLLAGAATLALSALIGIVKHKFVLIDWASEK